ncbi:MAG: hypothetical protein KJ000_32480 [Pirellulaceae bacterium]|nr:hypothetical protein [Pirellulaceae bacterium]
MTYRIHLFSAMLVCTATCALATQPNAPIVVSDQPESLSDVVPMPDPVDSRGQFYDKLPDAGCSCTDACGSCSLPSGCPSRGGHGECVGRMLGFGCENGCCGNTCNMPQHLMYHPTQHGYYYFIPYNHRTVLQQKLAVARYGGDPRNPYDNSMFQNIYEGLEPVSFELRDLRPATPAAPPTPETPPAPEMPALPPEVPQAPVTPPPPIERQLDPPAELPQAVPPTVIDPSAEPTVEPAAEPTVEPATEPAIEPAAEPAAEPVVDPFGDEASNLPSRPVAPALGSPVPVRPTVVPTVMLAPEMVLSETAPEPRSRGSRPRPVVVTFEGKTVLYENQSPAPLR